MLFTDHIRDVTCLIKYLPLSLGTNSKNLRTLKGTKRQQSGQMVQIFKTEKALEIQQARPTEACGKV